MKMAMWLPAALLLTGCAPEGDRMRVVEIPGASPLVTFRIVFLTGAASDPAGKEGLANLTAAMLAQGGTRRMSYQQILDAMFPMATTVSSQVDKEMTTFSAVTHADNLERFYALLREMLLEPGWREEDLKRLRDQTVNFLRVTLRGNNEEELAKEVLYNEIYQGHPYGHHNAGTVAGLESITLEDLRRFYARHYTQSRLILGIAGGYPKGFAERVKRDFSRLPAGEPASTERPAPKPIQGIQVQLIEKETRSVAYSIGFPIEVKRGDPDYLPLLVMQAYFGPHRTSGGRLFRRMRAERGLNYGDYAYIEYFPRGMFRFEPDPNLARPQQIFQIWIRPVEPETAHFALRLAFYELDKLIREGIPSAEFDEARRYLAKYVNLLLKTKDAELGYAIDSLYYGTPEYTRYVREGLEKLTLEQVNAAIRRHLRTRDLYVVAVTAKAQELGERLLSDAPSPMRYNAPKPAEILQEDTVVAAWKLGLHPEWIRVVPVGQVFER